MIWAHFILWASLWLASLLLVVGWEANVDRQRRGLTLPPVVVQGMTKWNQSLRGIALGDLVWICCDMYLVVVSGRHGAALSPMCATATCVSIFNYVEIIISYIYIYIYMIEILEWWLCQTQFRAKHRSKDKQIMPKQLLISFTIHKYFSSTFFLKKIGKYWFGIYEICNLNYEKYMIKFKLLDDDINIWNQGTKMWDRHRPMRYKYKKIKLKYEIIKWKLDTK